MAVKITCIKKSSGFHDNPYVAITDLGWVNEVSGKNGSSTRFQIYDFLETGGVAYVKDVFGNKAFLITAQTNNGTKYVKTVADSVKSDNLLSLGECK